MKTPDDYKEVNIDVLIKSEVTAVDSSKKLSLMKMRMVKKPLIMIN